MEKKNKMISVSKDILLPILAIDSYNQGYAPALYRRDPDVPPSETFVNTLEVGSATVFQRLENVSESFEAEAIEAGFYAIAYDTPFGTVISYRGTDNFFDTDGGIGGDGVNAYGIALGSPGGPQYNLAVEFYKSVVELP
jgi:hypothetical protein